MLPLTNTDANQVKLNIKYTIEDDSLKNQKINAVMKVFAPNGNIDTNYIISKWIYCQE